MKRVNNIELLRFFSAISVVLWHYQTFFNPWNTFSSIQIDINKTMKPFYSVLEYFYDYGYMGVPMFFTISGYVFAYVYLNKKEKTSGRQFFINRFARLYPLHFTTLIIVTLLQITSYKFTDSFQIYFFNDIYHFFLHLFFINGWGFQDGTSFNQPIWTVSLEVIVYALFFITIPYLNKFGIKFIIILYLALLLIDKSGIQREWTDIESLLNSCAKLFYSGIFVFYLCNKIKQKIYLIILSIILIAISLMGNFKAFVFFPPILLLFASTEDLISNKVQKYFQFFGNLTYASYLLHMPINMIIVLIFGYFNVLDIIAVSHYFFIFYFVLIIFLSAMCFKFFEKPLNVKIRSLLS